MQLTNLITLAFAASAFARNTPRQTEQFHYKRCGGFVVDPQTCDEGFQCLQVSHQVLMALFLLFLVLS